MRGRRAVVVAIAIVVGLVAVTRLVPRAIATASPGARRAWRAAVANAVRALTGDGSFIVLLGDSNTCGWPAGCDDNRFYWPAGGRFLPPGGSTTRRGQG